MISFHEWLRESQTDNQHNRQHLPIYLEQKALTVPLSLFLSGQSSDLSQPDSHFTAF